MLQLECRLAAPWVRAFGNAASQAQDIVLHAPVSLWIVLLASGLAILSGLVAGAFGGWRAARIWWYSRTSTSRGQLTKVRRDYIGFVFQDFSLIHTLNAYENVNTALEGRGIPNAEGLTIIVVTHDSGVAARAKRRLHLQGGQIFDESDPALRRHSTQGPLIARGIAGRKLRRRTQEEKLKPGCLEMCCENLQATRLLP
ncbi:hypothetical protein [Neomicrococcus lactis]|uniref:hypothetical protein n=1 Tax=Neomicrococcus lactis TaxID=732241 RepID=UPI002300209E|nr:hypothetical protein [Neomicrococcus lactis]